MGICQIEACNGVVGVAGGLTGVILADDASAAEKSDAGEAVHFGLQFGGGFLGEGKAGLGAFADAGRGGFSRAFSEFSEERAELLAGIGVFGEVDRFELKLEIGGGLA